MSLSRTELEHLSLISYIKEAILAPEFSQEVQNVPLVYDSQLYNGIQRTDYKVIDPSNPFGSLYKTKGRGLNSFERSPINSCDIYEVTTSAYVSTYGTPFDQSSYSIPTERELTSIKVYDQSGSEMDRSWYQIDYEKGRVRYPAPTTPSGIAATLTPTSIDFSFHMVAVLDGWPSQENTPNIPIVAVYPEKQGLHGFQIGPGVKFERSYCIDVFATSLANRRSLLDVIESGLFNKHSPVIDFNRSGQPLKQHGVINEDFIKDIHFNGKTYRSYLTLNPGNGNLLYFIKVEVLFDTSPRGNMSDSMRHMGKIRLTTCSKTDRDPKLVGKFNGLDAAPGGLDSLIVKGQTS